MTSQATPSPHQPETYSGIDVAVILKGVLNPNFRPFSFELKKN